MLNREQIVKEFNKKTGKRVKADSDAVIEGFIDLEVFGITEEMLYAVIEADLVHDKSSLLDWSFIKQAYESIAEPAVEPVVGEPVVEPAAEPAAEPAVVDVNNPFAMFESMINGVVLNQAKPMVESAIDRAMNEWCESNPSKITQVVEYEYPKTGTKTNGVVHEVFNDVRAYVDGGEPVMLVGPAGSGKNYLCKQIADSLGLEFYFTNAVTQEYKLTGFIDANGNYHETQFYKAFTQGGLFMFDEFDASDSNVLTVFNAMLENGYFDFPNIGRTYAHEDFRVIAACNTFGVGADYQYVGRNQLDAATLDRFEVEPVDYDENIEACITDDEDLLRFIRKFRKVCNEVGICHIVSYRAIRRLAKFKNALGCVKSMKAGLIKNLERDDLNMVVERFADDTDEWSEALKEIARGC